MASGVQAQALLAQAILGLHPEFGDGLDGETVDTGSRKVIAQWLIGQGVADLDGMLEVIDGPLDTYGVHREVHLALTLQCRWVYLQKSVYRAEAAVSGLGWMIVRMLEEIDGILSIVTPTYAESMGEYSVWYGQTNDADYRNELVDGCGEEITDADFAERFKPSDFQDSFGDPSVLDKGNRPRMSRRTLGRLQAEHPDPWIRSLAVVLLQMSRLGEQAGQEVRNPGEGSGPTEPMAIAKWTQDDAMDHVIDEWVQDNWNTGESLPYEFVWPIDTPECAAEAVERFESGFHRLRLFHALADLIEKTQ